MRYMTQYKVNFRSMPWTQTTNGVRQKIFKFDDRQLRLVEYSKLMPPHWCERGHVGYMLEGKMEVRFENEIQTYSAGDGVYLPAGPEHKHCARILTDTAIFVFVEDT
jgi:mannose-6-phosphate isomerase-like protein (cupin superfamily)